MDHQVRAARITDIDRLVTLCADAPGMTDGDGTLVAPDLLRQLVYLPNATVLVAEIRRSIVGVAILALRPSIRAGGFVGTVDLLVGDPRHDLDAVADALIEEVIKSARNKGCTVVEVARPEDSTERARWARNGFRESDRLLERPVVTRRAGSRPI